MTEAIFLSCTESRAAKLILRMRGLLHQGKEWKAWAGGWQYFFFFFFLVPEVRRPLPAVWAGGLPSPPTLGRACSRQRRAWRNHSSRHRWLRIRRGLVRRPGPERCDGAFVFSRPRPTRRGFTRLPPSLSAHRWAPSPARGPGRDNRTPRIRGGWDRKRLHRGTKRGGKTRAQPAADEGRPPRGRGRASGERGPGLPRAAAPAAAAELVPRGLRPGGLARGCARLADGGTPGERRLRLHEARRELARRAREARHGGWGGGGRGGGGARAGPACPRGRRWQRPRRRRGGLRPERSARAAARGSAPPPPAPA